MDDYQSKREFFIPIVIVGVVACLFLFQAEWTTIALFSGAIVVYGEFVQPHDKGNWRIRLGRRIVLFGVLLGVWSTYKANAENDAKQDAISDAVNDNLALSKNNLEKSNENTERQEEMINVMTGAGSTFYLHFTTDQTGKNVAEFRVNGKYGVPHVHYEVFEVTDSVERKLNSTNLLYARDIGPVNNAPLRDPVFELPDKSDGHLAVMYSEGGRLLFQRIIFHRVKDSQYLYAYKIAEMIDGIWTLLPQFSHTDSGYPVNEDMIELEKFGIANTR